MAVRLVSAESVSYGTTAPSPPTAPPPSTHDRNDEQQKPTDHPASWRTLPHKTQLLVLALCRLSEPLTQTSLLSYLYFMLRSFHAPRAPPPSAAAISRQAGIMAASFAAAQCATGMLWGRLSDHVGRKPCLLFGLFGTIVSVVGFAFSHNFETALAFRILGGCLNGNVGVLRTIVSETVREQKHQARAFLIMPMCFNIGIIVGPALGGLLAEPSTNWPGLFGSVGWMKSYPYALPNVVSAVFLTMSWVAGFLFLHETHPSKTHRRDIGRDLRKSIQRVFVRRSYPPTPTDDDGEAALLLPKKSPKTPPPTIPFLQIFTPNILMCLLAFTLQPLHNASFIQLFGIFLSTPRSPLPPHFPQLTGGLGLSAHSVGLAMATLGTIGISIQLFIYPPLQARLGVLRSFRIATACFPIAYLLTPLLILFHDNAAWCAMVTVLLVQVAGRTFTFPSAVLLLTNSVEVEGVLGTVHGVGSSLASASRAIGPLAAAWGFARGLENDGVQGVYWTMAAVAASGSLVAGNMKMGKGLGA